jgi:phospholipid/cholesterol/gamma-HCH transport system substrate-binding protein
MPHNGIRALTGLTTVAVIAAIAAVAVGLFQGSFTETTPVTVLSPRAGLVMNPDAKVKMRGVQVGKVASIESRPNGQAVIHLAMNPSEMHLIPANVRVDLTAPTVFGAKFVDLVPPAEASARSLHAGQVLDSEHVTVEVNTVFQRLSSVLDTIDPAKLNETLGALAKAFSGRGEKIGQALSDLDSFLAKVDPSLTALSHATAILPAVSNAYADAAPNLVKTAANATAFSKTIVDEQRNLDALLISAIGLADIGNDVIGTNRKSLTDALHVLVPTTDLTNAYNKAFTCGFGGLVTFTHAPPLFEPGIHLSSTLLLGSERYRYPTDLPKVAATGGPQCTGLPKLPFNTKAKYVVADTGANPWKYGNPQMLLNFDGLKQLLYGPIAGPPRNPAQVGQQG